MSTVNHPNFHAVKFTTDITSSFVKCLRGKAGVKNIEIGPTITGKILDLVDEIEKEVDKQMEE